MIHLYGIVSLWIADKFLKGVLLVMAKWKSAKNLNQKGLAVAGLTSSTVADDTHTEENQGSSKQRVDHNTADNQIEQQ